MATAPDEAAKEEAMNWCEVCETEALTRTVRWDCLKLDVCKMCRGRDWWN